MTAEDPREIIQHNRKLIQQYKRHKRVIEEQIAGFGKLHAPSHLVLQMSDYDEQIQECQQAIEHAKDELMQPLIDRMNSIDSLYVSLERVINSTPKDITYLQNMIDALHNTTMIWGHEMDDYQDADVAHSMDKLYERATQLQNIFSTLHTESGTHFKALEMLRNAIVKCKEKIAEIDKL